MGTFNPFLRKVIVRVSEARDLGDVDRYRLYEHLKTMAAAPPDTLTVNEKNRQQYQVPNVCGLVFTTNYPNSIYLPKDDRRFFVAWSSAKREAAPDAGWTDFEARRAAPAVPDKKRAAAEGLTAARGRATFIGGR